MSSLVYFSSVSENTRRFVEKLGIPATRIPLHANDFMPTTAQPYVLIVPTYGGGNEGGAVPKQVIRFLNDPVHRALLCGVIATGNTNFGSAYGIAGNIIAAKCGVPHLCTVELVGTPEDVDDVTQGLEILWHTTPHQ